jgi:hypothetical protein
VSSLWRRRKRGERNLRKCEAVTDVMIDETTAVMIVVSMTGEEVTAGHLLTSEAAMTDDDAVPHMNDMIDEEEAHLMIEEETVMTDEVTGEERRDEGKRGEEEVEGILDVTTALTVEARRGERSEERRGEERNHVPVMYVRTKYDTIQYQ